LASWDMPSTVMADLSTNIISTWQYLHDSTEIHHESPPPINSPVMISVSLTISARAHAFHLSMPHQLDDHLQPRDPNTPVFNWLPSQVTEPLGREVSLISLSYRGHSFWAISTSIGPATAITSISSTATHRCISYYHSRHC
jgi:hypothetical protein